MARQNEFEPAKDGKFTRRDFLRISGGLLISVTFADLLAACAPETLTETVTKTTTTTKTNLNTVVNTATETATSIVNVTKTATNTVTDTITKTVEPVNLRIGTTFACEGLISIASGGGTFWRMNYYSSCAAPFLEYGVDGNILPNIMTAWEIAEDNKSIIATFATDKGITWHDGKPLIMDDIIFSFDFVKNILKYSEVSDLDHIEQIDDTKLKMYFNTSAFDFINKLVMIVWVYPKHIWEGITDPKTFDSADAAIGCGPYKYIGRDLDAQTIYFEAVDNYFKGELTVKKVSIRSFGSADTLILALKNGEIDAMSNYSSGLDASASPSITGVADLDSGMSINPGNYQLTFGFNQTPTNELQFRKASAYALDYALLASAIGGEVPGTGIIAPPNVGFDDTLPKLKQDIALSKSILDEAGYLDINNDGYRELPTGEPMNVIVNTQYNKSKGTIFARIAEIVVSNLKAVGINTALDEKGVTDSAYSLSVFRGGTYQLYVGLTSYGWAHYWTAFSYMIAGGNPAGGTCNIPEVVTAYNGLMTAKNTEEYITYVQDLQKLADQYTFGLALCWDNVYFPYRTDKYEGWVNFPGNGVINNGTWYNVKSK